MSQVILFPQFRYLIQSNLERYKRHPEFIELDADYPLVRHTNCLDKAMDIVNADPAVEQVFDNHSKKVILKKRNIF